MSESSTSPAATGCALVFGTPILIAYSGLGTLWEAFVLHKIWLWHLAVYFDSIQVMSVPRIFAVLLMLWIVRRMPTTQKQTDTRTQKEKLWDVGTTLVFPILTPALALLFAWWAT